MPGIWFTFKVRVCTGMAGGLAVLSLMISPSTFSSHSSSVLVDSESSNEYSSFRLSPLRFYKMGLVEKRRDVPSGTYHFFSME